MRAVTAPPYGGPEVLAIVDAPEPDPGPNDLLVRVRAVGVNRADCLQRAGNYPPPPGQGDILGLELAGEVAAVGSAVSGFAPGQRVFGLVASGAYADHALLDHRLALPVPEGWSFVQAAAVIEIFATANETVFGLGDLKRGESILVHAGGSGVGTTAIQMAKHAGATVFFTAGSAEKIQRGHALGADHGINYRAHDFVEEVFRLSEGRGVDVILDFIGAEYLARNLSLLRDTGRLVMVGLMGEPRCLFDPAIMLRKRLKILGFTLRRQPIENKQAIVRRVRERWLPLLVDGALRPVLHGTFPFEQVAEAHAAMEANRNFGKIVLTMD
jgi:putative PIG3 family NAD(P)H quinone oxidoreductase